MCHEARQQGRDCQPCHCLATLSFVLVCVAVNKCNGHIESLLASVCKLRKCDSYLPMALGSRVIVYDSLQHYWTDCDTHGRLVLVAFWQTTSTASQPHPEHMSFSGRATPVVIRRGLVLLLQLNAEGISKAKTKVIQHLVTKN